jgi:hypothetical protein
VALSLARLLLGLAFGQFDQGLKADDVHRLLDVEALHAQRHDVAGAQVELSGTAAFDLTEDVGPEDRQEDVLAGGRRPAPPWPDAAAG